MKLTKLLQWLKTKLLPSSVLRKGRLAVERFNKQRLNVLNFGVVFRNSKWADYSKKNINQNKSSFVVKTFVTIITLILFLLLLTLVMGVDFTKTIISIGYWQLRDLTDYFWLCAAAGYSTVSAVLKPILLDLWARLFFPPEMYEAYKNSQRVEVKKPKKTKKKKNKPHVAAEHDNPQFNINWKLFEGLKSLTFSSRAANLFKTSFELVRGCFLVSNLSQRTDDQRAASSLKFVVRKDFKMYDTTPITSENGPLASLRMWTNASGSEWGTNRKRYRNSQYTTFDTLRCGNTTFDIYGLNNYSKIRKFILFRELLPLSTLLNDLTSISKSKRWLYQYNLLQSKSVMATNGITGTKRLTSPGAYTFDMLSGNLWVSNTLSKMVNVGDQFTPLFKSVYGNYLTRFVDNNNIYKNYFFKSPNKNLEFAKFYESGYLWFLKRFYFLNANSTHGVRTALLASTPTQPLSASEYSDLVLLNLRLAKVLTPFASSTKLELPTETGISDVFYGTDSNILFNQSTLLTLSNILSDRTSPSVGVSYYSLNNYSTELNLSQDSFKVRFFKSSKSQQVLSDIFKHQPKMSPAYIDLIHKKYTKDLYSFIVLNTKK